MSPQDRVGWDNENRQPWQRASRVAFFGGSFDPPHLGHLAIARAAREAFGLEAVIFAPVGIQPLKPEGPSASFEQRVAMTRLAIQGEPGFSVSLADAPTSQSGSSTPNFTIETLEALRAELRPGSTLYCLMGADSFLGLHRWHRAAEVPLVAPLIVASRPGRPLHGLEATLPPGLTLQRTPGLDRKEAGVEVRSFTVVGPGGNRTPFYVLPGIDVEISATAIREQLGNSKDAAYAGTALPGQVADYIRAHRLYR